MMTTQIQNSASLHSDDRCSALLSFAGIEPPLRYRWRGALDRGTLADATETVVADYLVAQPAEYIEELSALYRLNMRSERRQQDVFVFVVCYNELANLERIVELYARQESFDLSRLQLTFLVNYTTRSDPKKNAIDERIFQRSVARLVELKDTYDFIHVVPKRFSAKTGGLARARKYAMDYSILSAAQSKSTPTDALLISNEGDTVDLPKDYLRAWAARFSKEPTRLVQGNIAYPKDLDRAPLVKLYAQARESVHLGQGLYDKRYPFFEGVMLTGRNYAVHPKVACLAGGIDPTARAGAEDDPVFGSDVHNLLGPTAKGFAEDIFLTTHPRREIVIAHALLRGQADDAKKVYETFHEVTDIYDMDWEHYISLLDAAGRIQDCIENRCVLVNQFYQWVFRTVIKNYFAIDARFREIFDRWRCHEIGYWQREDDLWKAYIARLADLPEVDRERLLGLVVDESLTWFNQLLRLPRPFEEATIELDSRLVR